MSIFVKRKIGDAYGGLRQRQPLQQSAERQFKRQFSVYFWLL